MTRAPIDLPPIDPRVGVERPPRLPELEGLPVEAQWRLIAIVNEKRKGERAGSRAIRVVAVVVVWLLGAGAALELAWAGLPVTISIAVTAGLARGTSAWLRRRWLRTKIADLRDSNACHWCDYPLPERTAETTCPECGVVNDLRLRRWWRAEVTTAGGG